ncbi:valine--tRNA ligase [Phytophthora nicotianae]|uniref:Valine--tRNA ligase n=1 Tax=Phytophthora nicotianae TaxID=4792 RepID=A0A0W8DI66_PHYNI|nr:valine--tRNA ligase [Phytophthora nicotianae]
MFRVFSKYNALFFRPRIRSAVQQFQMQLIENVKEDVSNLQAKFRAHYAYSEASRTSKLRDIPPIAGAVMWAKQIERKLKMLLSRVESVLGIGWEQHVEGKALKAAAEAFIAKLNPQLIFDQWVNDLASMPIFDIKNIILNIVTEDTPQGEKKKLVVAFNQQIVTLFKEVRNLEWLGYRVPFTLKMIAEDAKSKYPFAMSLDASLKTYTSSCRRIQPIFEALTAAYVREVRATIGKTFTKGNEMRWHADGLGEYVTDLATKVERLHDKVDELLQKTSEIDALLESVRTSSDFQASAVQAVLAKVQAHVDELSLAGYANLHVFVKNLNVLISEMLGKKLEVLLQRWVACFGPQPDEKSFQAALAEAGLTVTTHQILLKNQVLYLEPSVGDARREWLAQLQNLLNSVCDLPKIQTSSYENVYGKSTVLALSSPPRKSASSRWREAVFKEALNKVPLDLLIKAYGVLDVTVSDVEKYASTWLQYQALWDMDAQTALNSFGEDLRKWQQILVDIKNERNAFDAVFNTKRFGPMVINYQQVQAQVNVKYDAWHNEFLAYFGDLLRDQINSFYSTISSKRTLLEQHALEAATAQVVAAITLIQEMRQMRVQWEEAVESFEQGERLLKKQRYRFTADWPSLANVEGEWEAFIQLLERKTAAMESQLPQLQAKIMEEKSTLDSKINKGVAEWDSSKPLQGDQSPKAATETLIIFDTRFKLLRAEQDKTNAALNALNISYVSGMGGSSIDDDRSSYSDLSRAMEELAGLDEVWKSISKVWVQVDELQDTLWSAVHPRKVRKQLDEIVDEMRRFLPECNSIFFGSADIKQQLPKEFARFQSVDNEFTSTMKRVAHKPMIVDVANIPNLYHSLERQQDMMGNVQRALGEYLERQRAAFPRFYFVGDEDLLEMIGNSKEPMQIQRHLSKMFAGISSASEDDRRYRINIWLGKVEEQMRKTLSLLLEEAVRSYPTDDNAEAYLKWVSEFPAQVIILATQVQWSNEVESVLKAGGDKLSVVIEQLDKLLLILSERVLTDVKNDVRKKYEQLITELVHQKSVTKRLSQAKVGSAEDFRWLYHMRHYFQAKESDPLKKLTIQISNASFSYGFEYFGVGERLVQTPLTERCYLTLTQALDFGMGGNPFGPAGTGKTESVKALGSHLGRFVLVFNCDEHFDFQAMGPTIELLGKSVKLNPDVGIFVTMNPGYAGRSNLPDNLKQLFRSIAMVAPDRELIAQVMLFSQGITTAEQISAKVVLLFNLCEDQLSKQPHYDFGLRALKSVLVSAGQLKRKITQSQDDATPANIEELETKALIGSITDTILPKLVSNDVPVFETLLKGVFPGTEAHRIEEDTLRARIVELAKKNNFVAYDQWVEKALQLYQVMQLRHGVMLVGASGTGKSSAWRVLMNAMELVDGVKGEAHVIDPKALSKEHLYGVLDNTTLEWTDGVFTHLLRQVLNSVRGESEKRHWIIFDGDVDPEWAENLNSVLDDNRLLTLPSGERLEIPPNVWIMMETETLRYATLATVSRCGMVWFSHDTVKTCHIVEHYLLKMRDDVSVVSSFSLQPSESELAKKTAHTYVALLRELISRGDGMPSLIEICLEQAMGQVHIMEVTALRLLMSMFTLLGRGLSRINEYNEGHSDFPMTIEQIARFVPKWFVFSVLWGFGGSMDSSNRMILCDFVVQTLENRLVFPVSASSSPDNSLLEYEVNIDDGEWRQWLRSIPQLDLESHQVLSTDVVVTTVDTIRHVEVLRGWLSQHRPLILCGPPGSGKTMTLTSTINSLPEFEFASLNFSSGTSPDLILKTFSQYCEYKRTPNGMLLAPNAPEKWLVVFCDEINLPEADRYGTQRVITFLRQLIEQGGFWLGGKNTWVRLERIQFVGACNPPTDPGRVPISLRLLRHAPVLLVDFPSYPSLKQIYGTFNRALLKLTPSLRSYVQPLTDAMVDVYDSNQKKFTAEMQPHYIYSPRELSRWMRALYEAIEPLEYEIDIETLVKLVFHEALRLFMDRLVTSDEQKWCFRMVKETLRNHFPQSATALEVVEYGGQHPILFSTWLSKNYTEVTTTDLRKHIEARLRVFYEEELNVQLVVFDSVIDHVLRIDRVLRQPLGHLLLVGESGAGKTVLSRFVSWMNGMSVFQIKLTSNYTLDNFDDDLRVVLKRCGCEAEKICFIFDESNVLDSAFLERMNALLASGEVPGLFEDDEYTSLMHACREAVQRDGVIVENTEDELFRYFTKQVQRNLHVVFTMNPASGDFQNRTNTSPALFNRCVVDWFGTWNDHALAQVAYEFTNTLDLAGSSDFIIPDDAAAVLAKLIPHIATGTFRDVLVGSIVQFHHAVLLHMRRLQKRHMKYNHISPRDYLEFIRHFVSLYSEKRAQLEDQQLHLNVGVQKLQATHEQVEELQGQLSLKEKELKKKDVEANEKLQQMVQEQNEAQEKKKDTEALAADLASKDEEIRSRKEVVEADLAQAEPALLDAQASVNSIRKAQLDEIRALARPPAAVRMTMEAVAVMLGESSLEWADLRKFIRKDDFISQVVNFDSEKLTGRQRHTIQTNYVDKVDEFDYEKVNRASKACGPLYKWIVSQLNYTNILHKIQPLRDEVQTLIDTSSDLRERYEQAKKTIDALEIRIENFKHEYAALINEAQIITNDMASVSKKVERSVALLKSLLQESERWEAGSNDFDTQMKTLVGDTLLSSAFLTYIGFLDFQQRKILVQDWRDILDSMGISTKPQLSFVDYLSRRMNSWSGR